MARHGGRKQQKRLSAPRSWKIYRKSHTWVVNTIPGPHRKELSVPLLVLIRDILGLCETAREGRYIINRGEILIDGKVRKNYRFPVGLFDVVSIPKLNKHFRMIMDSHGRIVPREIPEEEKNRKVARVINKYMAPGGRLMITTHDGRNFEYEANIGDSVVINLEKNAIEARIPLEKGTLAYILSGRYSGSVGKVLEVIPGDMTRDPLVKLEVEGKEVYTVKENVFPVGLDKPEVSL